MRYGLGDGSLSVVTNLGNKTILDISVFLKSRLLIAESASINRKEVRRISWVDVNTGQSAALYSGIIARYLEGAGVVVYDDGESLFAVALSGDYNIETIFTHRMNQVSTVMVVSENTVLFETRESGDWQIHSYNVVTGSLRSLERLSMVCRLDQAVWIDDLEQLVCKEQLIQSDYPRYFLTNLEGDVGGTLTLPEGKHFEAMTYIKGQDALVLMESWTGVIGGQIQSSIWVHNFKTRETNLLVKNQSFGSSVVYTNF